MSDLTWESATWMMNSDQHYFPSLIRIHLILGEGCISGGNLFPVFGLAISPVVVQHIPNSVAPNNDCIRQDIGQHLEEGVMMPLLVVIVGISRLGIVTCRNLQKIIKDYGIKEPSSFIYRGGFPKSAVKKSRKRFFPVSLMTWVQIVPNDFSRRCCAVRMCVSISTIKTRTRMATIMGVPQYQNFLPED